MCIVVPYCTVLCCAVQYYGVLSAIKAYNGYQPRQKVLWINPAANITYSIITPETAGLEPSTLRGHLEEYGHSLEGDCHDDVDFRH